MAPMRGDQDMVARAKIALAFAFDPQTGRAGEEQNPFVVVLIIRLVLRRRLTGRDNPLDAHALAREQLGEYLLVHASRQVAEKVDHDADLRSGLRRRSRARACARGHTIATASATASRFPPRRAIMPIALYVAILWVLIGAACVSSRAQTVAAFDFELIDTSLEGETNGPRADEQARLTRLSDELRRRLAESGRFTLVDTAPVAGEARASNLQACGGCDTRLAERIGAELAITGTVQKVSNLILNMNIYVRDVSSGATVAAVSADMRGNTDESWSRTLDWLVRNRLLAPGYGVRQ